MRTINFYNKIWDTLRLLSTELDDAFKPMVETVGLTMMQARILFEIRQKEDTTVGGLGDICNVNNGNCSTICKKLEKAGLIDRIRSKADERIVTLSLTTQGKELLDTIEKKLNDKYNQVLVNQSQEKFNIIIEGMNALQELLQELNEKISQRSNVNE
jgi:DNA-binding MarR family transcriptional regulator